MKNLESFVNLYPLSKTLRFALLPVGKTEENFNRKQLLLQDQKRAEEHEKVKEYIDRYHKYYIESVLADECKVSSLLLDNVKTYAALYSKSSRNDKDEKNMEELEKSMRKSIADILKSDERFASLFSEKMITELLPGFLRDRDELASLDMFKKFTTYFAGFNTNRKNMYSDEEQSTAVPYRCINDNLPKFLDNIRVFKTIKEHLPEDEMTDLNETYFSLYGVKAEDMFCVDYFAFVLSQSGIEKYNGVIGGYKCQDGTKQKGVNECVNLYNQAHPSDRIPLLKPLYKQILSDKQSISFIPEKFKSDDEVLSAIEEYYCSIATEAEDKKITLNELEEIFNGFDSFNHDGIFVASGAAVTDISNAVFKDWSAVREGWNREYEARNPLKSGRNAEKYSDKQNKAYKSIKSFSVSELQKFGQAGAAEEHKDAHISDFFKKAAAEKIPAIRAAYTDAQSLLERPYAADKKLAANENAVALLKNLLDAFKDLQKFIKPLLGTGKEEGKDDEFYGRLLPAYENLSAIDSLYDKVRNYVTQKPYSTDKIKLNFENYNLLGGWDKNKEMDYHTVILRKGELYYLAIMDKERTDAFVSPPQYTDGEFYDKLEYKLLPGPNKMLPKVFFAPSNKDKFSPDEQILSIRKRESFKKGGNFNLDDCHRLINFFKQSIAKHEDWSKFDFKFSPTESYNDISEFYREVSDQGYKISFRKIPKAYIDELIDGGMLYVFQIYNKDFSTNSHGKQNLHTMYFKMLFDERNIKNPVYKLSGGAEMFYRPASINEKEKITHPAYLPITNKNSLNPKHESTFAYDIIKDRRYTERQFLLHVPITLNFKAKGRNFINDDVRKAVKDSDNNYIIGIDRGERNLLYICVIDGQGDIVEQRSLNEIISDNGYRVYYHKLLQDKEEGRDKARAEWKNIENIKELKEGYLSQVIHEICRLVLKYNAIIAMENLNFGFKRGRFKVERQVYQKFENMLITKLNYLVQKDADPESPGGLLKAYQLTNKVDGVNKGRQNGIIFYVPAWLTSKIDPTTGFVDLLWLKYTSVKDTIELIQKLDDVRYNADEGLYEFDINYSKFPKCTSAYRKKWTVCSNAERISTFRNPAKNSNWDYKTVILTEEFNRLFEEYGINKGSELKSQMLDCAQKNGSAFCKEFVKLLALCLQLRNSMSDQEADIDYLISPVKNSEGKFYDSREYDYYGAALPRDADANGAYNIARKALWAVNNLKRTDDEQLKKADISVKNAEWLEFAQR